jgi:ribonuclease T2
MRLVLVALPALIAADPVHGFERLDGFFMAVEECEAHLSKNNGSNPGEVRTVPSQIYEVLGLNAPDGNFYQIRIPGAPVTPDRWVLSSCGVHSVSVKETRTGGVPVVPLPADPGLAESVENLLALSWEPAFCEMRAGMAECDLLNAGRMPMAEIQLSVHGLWPQPEGKSHCGVPDELIAIDEAGSWEDLPAVEIGDATQLALERFMPGTMSYLHRHQWIKHGTCFQGKGGAEEYFEDTLRVTGVINQSEVAGFLATSLGEEIRTSEIRARFDTAFGPGAGERVEFACADDGARRLLQEIRVHLSGRISADASVADLILAAGPVSIGCNKAIIDIFGLQ